MLTRLELDGFKTFRDFSIDFPPFLVILGKNASGKSNLFDAIQFLRLTANGSLLDAVQEMRGEIEELFHTPVVGDKKTQMRIAAEVLLPPRVRDAFDDEVEVRHSRIRYELVIELRSTERGVARANRPFVASEAVTLIRLTDDGWLKRASIPAKSRSNYVRYSSRSSEVMLETTESESGKPVFSLRQEGHSGKPRHLPAGRAQSTVISSLTTATEFPLLYALKSEMQSWRLMHLDPSSLRTPSSFDDDDVLRSSGLNLPNALKRITEETSSAVNPLGVLVDLTSNLARTIPGITDLEFDEDPSRRQRSLRVVTRGEAPFSASVASDGTLRAIALFTALLDATHSGLICFEEPENGIYPQRLVEFVRELRRLVEQSLERRLGNPEAPLAQLVLSSHSPVILRALGEDHGYGFPGDASGSPRLRTDAVFVDTAALIGGRSKSRVTRARRIPNAGQTEFDLDERSRSVGLPEIETVEVWTQLGAS